MIQDLLTVSKFDQAVKLKFEDVDLWELVGTVQQQLSSLATAKRIIIEQCIDTDNCQIAGILDELERMMLNLIGNAIHYTPEGGTITIRLISPREGYLCLEVADTGIGISEDDMAHIFERFYRVDKARSTHTGGTGLGLPIVKQIVERHHGDIRIDSQVGVGTTFSILLPVSSDS
jgi:two-component system, OmpR family, phosphate regulon sensor histidine kinase PhoR